MWAQLVSVCRTFLCSLDRLIPEILQIVWTISSSPAQVKRVQEPQPRLPKKGTKFCVTRLEMKRQHITHRSCFQTLWVYCRITWVSQCALGLCVCDDIMLGPSLFHIRSSILVYPTQTWHASRRPSVLTTRLLPVTWLLKCEMTATLFLTP